MGNSSSAGVLLASINKLAGGVGLVPEQDWDFADVPASAYGSDPTTASIGDPCQRQRIEVRDVVRREDHRTVARDPLLAFDRPSQSVPQSRVEDAFRHGIQDVHGR